MPIVNSNERENHGNISLINLFLKNLFSCLIKKKKRKSGTLESIKDETKSQKVKHSPWRIISLLHLFSLPALTFCLSPSGESTLFLHLSRAYLQAGVLVSIYGPPLSQHPENKDNKVCGNNFMLPCLTFF